MNFKKYNDCYEHQFISIGISSLIPSPNLRPESLFAADRALYTAKERDRNVYVIHIA
ncbi:hypothetical protein HC931_10265 [Candidatus Gracilibacteria bacterium]|nr:hypothetical protein [Candidatus Gracilibacteria bacterium]NJM90067.1 hypothetical protein [Hydrococcus sp. RU_2_2]NJP20524.1 hypothetical protein [Hydrococcus sp. CRU_1_1]